MEHDHFIDSVEELGPEAVLEGLHADRTYLFVVSLLGQFEDPKLLGGGQTLLPTLKQRLARPSDLVDLGQIPELQGIREEAGGLTIGAFITPLWLGRGHVTVMAIAIHEQMVTLVDWPGGAASAMLLTVSTLLLLVAYGLFLRRYARR